jgi:hypothetical protein
LGSRFFYKGFKIPPFEPGKLTPRKEQPFLLDLIEKKQSGWGFLGTKFMAKKGFIYLF